MDRYELPRQDWYDEDGRIYKDALIENFNSIEKKLHELAEIDPNRIAYPDISQVEYPDVTLESDDNCVVNLKSFLDITKLTNVPLNLEFSGKVCKICDYFGDDYTYHQLRNVSVNMDKTNKYIYLDSENHTVVASDKFRMYGSIKETPITPEAPLSISAYKQNDELTYTTPEGLTIKLGKVDSQTCRYIDDSYKRQKMTVHRKIELSFDGNPRNTIKAKKIRVALRWFGGQSFHQSYVVTTNITTGLTYINHDYLNDGVSYFDVEESGQTTTKLIIDQYISNEWGGFNSGASFSVLDGSLLEHVPPSTDVPEAWVLVGKYDDGKVITMNSAVKHFKDVMKLLVNMHKDYVHQYFHKGEAKGIIQANNRSLAFYRYQSKAGTDEERFVDYGRDAD